MVASTEKSSGDTRESVASCADAGANELVAVVLNYYGSCTITVPGIVTLTQTTDYPYASTIRISINPATGCVDCLLVLLVLLLVLLLLVLVGCALFSFAYVLW